MGDPSDDLASERLRALDAIDRRRPDAALLDKSRTELDEASTATLRRLASSLRAAAWGDHTTSAEEAGEIADDPGWAPNETLRVAALIDHLSELGMSTGIDLPPVASKTSTLPNKPKTANGRWTQMAPTEIARRLGDMAQDGVEVTIFDAVEGACLARATSWRGEIVEVVDLVSLPARLSAQNSVLQSKDGNEAKHAAKAEKGRLELKPRAWGDALVRSGFARPHFGPHLTAGFFQRHVVARHRLDITVDANAIVHGLVHHVARVAPHVDFARSAITDLEIQRLYDHDRGTWRKACRAIEGFPSDGPVWRTLGPPDTTALLVARADQKGKAPGADALLAHNFEEALLRAHGIRAILLTADNGLARTLAARLPKDSVWVGYVDPLVSEERFVSPILSWPTESITESRYSSLAQLLDELLVCGVAEHLIATDGSNTVEFRAHFDGEHQYAMDWREPELFVRGLGVASASPTAPSNRWPLRVLDPPWPIRPSGARVTVDQVAVALEWVRVSDVEQLSRNKLPLSGDARDDAWNFLRAVGVVDSEGRAVGRHLLSSASAQRDMEALRALILGFDPLTKIVASIESGARSVEAVKKSANLSGRTFGAALGLSIACGLSWRKGDSVGPGKAFVSREDFLEWLLTAVVEPIRLSALAERSALDLGLSPARFREALAAVVDDPRLVGARGGSAESHELDARVLTIAAEGQVGVTELSVDDILGLRSLSVRP